MFRSIDGVVSMPRWTLRLAVVTLLADLPSASFITEVQIPDGVVVGRLPRAGPQEYFAIAFEKASPFVQCVNLALGQMKDDGTLDEIRQEWLGDGADAPLIEGEPRAA